MRMTCDKCGEDTTLFESVDAFGCLKCDEWKEDKCTVDSCGYCIERKEKPSLQNKKGE
jgi:hypothetical protein